MADTILRDLWRDPLPTNTAAGVTPQKLMEVVRDIMRTDLSEHEKGTQSKGGHTLEAHVGKTSTELQSRITSDSLTEASVFFHDQKFVEAVIAKAILSDLHRVYNWYHRIDDPPPAGDPRQGGNSRKFICITAEINFPVGTVFELLGNGTFKETQCSHVFVKIKRGSIGGRNKYIVTGYPCIPKQGAS